MLTTPFLVFEWLNKTFNRNHTAHHFCHSSTKHLKGCVLSSSAKSKQFWNLPISFAFNSVSFPNFQSLHTAPFYVGSAVITIARGFHQTQGRAHSLSPCFFLFGSAQVRWLRRFDLLCWKDTRALCIRSSPTTQWWSTLIRWTFLTGWTGHWITKPSFTLTACPTQWMPLIMTSKLEKLVWIVVF